MADRVGNTRPARVMVGMHGGLKLHQQHLDSLRALLEGEDVAALLERPGFARREVLERLESRELDVIYLYCHAEMGTRHGTQTPVLKFRAEEPKARVGEITEADIPRVTWPHRPLVILNGCKTGAFRPDALSPFVRKLTMTHQAAGVVATEISVWERLAGEVALNLLGGFLRGAAAGEAVRQMRRDLLAKHNPLGLAYTLYAALELKLEQRAPSRSPQATGTG